MVTAHNVHQILDAFLVKMGFITIQEIVFNVQISVKRVLLEENVLLVSQGIL